MIEKRYQFHTKSGKQWTNWFKFSESNSKQELDKLSKNPETKWQLKNDLLNEYRITKIKEL